MVGEARGVQVEGRVGFGVEGGYRGKVVVSHSCDGGRVAGAVAGTFVVVVVGSLLCVSAAVAGGTVAVVDPAGDSC